MKNKWGRGGGLNREAGLIDFLPLKRGGLLEGGGLFERGGGVLNRGFTVSLFTGKRHRPSFIRYHIFVTFF